MPTVPALEWPPPAPSPPTCATTPPTPSRLLTADIPATFEYSGGRDAAAADGTFPLAIYSHGFSGINVGSSFLTAHLASWGIAVAAPEHPSRDLAAATSFTLNSDPQASVDDVLAYLDSGARLSDLVSVGGV